MSSTMNSFLAIDLSPDVLDPSQIEAAIRRKQAQWSREAHQHPDPQTKRRAQESLERLVLIRTRLMDAHQRRQQADEARTYIAGVREQKLPELREAVELLCRGPLQEEAVKRLVSRFRTAFFSENEIRQMIHRRINIPGSSRQGKGLEESLARQIRQNLVINGSESLFVFLNLSSRASLEEVHQAIDKTAAALKKAPIDAENDVRRTLLGFCRVVFRDDTRRRAYLHTLRLEQLRPFLEMIDNCCDAGKITIDQLLHLVQIGERYRLGWQAVQNFVLEKARRRKIPVDLIEGLELGRELKCACGTKNRVGALHCQSCGQKLYVRCSRCKKMRPTDLMTCSCGFSLKGVERALQLAMASNQQTEFIQLWEEYGLSGYPAFGEMLPRYQEFKRIAAQEGEKRQRLQRNLRDLVLACRRGDDGAIRRAWDPVLITQRSDIQSLLPRVRKAFQSQPIREVAVTPVSGGCAVNWEMALDTPWYQINWSVSKLPVGVGEGSVIRLSRGQYLRRGCQIAVPPGETVYVVVRGVRQFCEELLIGPAEVSCSSAQCLIPRETDIVYEIKRPPYPGSSQLTLLLSSSGAIEKLPEL
ncbi:MAG TPA: zinc ribbon domain-containing protein, partial [Calditrichia bacterium]|nr:zinc ribbon domain-containing protein [Calditrichia bacterium]